MNEHSLPQPTETYVRTVTAGGRVSLPSELRMKHGIRAGDQLECTLGEHGELILQLTPKTDLQHVVPDTVIED